MHAAFRTLLVWSFWSSFWSTSLFSNSAVEDASTTLTRDSRSSLFPMCTNTVVYATDTTQDRPSGTWTSLWFLPCVYKMFNSQTWISQALRSLSVVRLSYQLFFIFLLSLRHLLACFLHQLCKPLLPPVQVLCYRDGLSILCCRTYSWRLRWARKRRLKFSRSIRTMGSQIVLIRESTRV